MQQDAASSAGTSAALLNSVALEAYEPKLLDITSAQRSIWLAKVPKYLAEMWMRRSREQPGASVGIIRNVRTKAADGQLASEITYKPSDELREQFSAEFSDQNTRLTLSDHNFTLLPVHNQSLYVLMEQLASSSSQKPSGEAASNVVDAGASTSQGQSGSVADRRVSKRQLVGMVTRKWECRPQADAAYMLLKRARTRAQNAPAKRVTVVTDRVDNFMPKNDHKHIIEDKMRKQDQSNSRPRVEGDKLKEVVFRLFEGRQRFSMGELMGRTGQTVAGLKSVLGEIAIYNKEGEYRNTYELKPEYRYYSAS